jgi:glutamate/tyrosine decarboxylase-like PLP-dependent enzyme
VDLLASACEPGLTAMPSGRFFGFVIGGSHPAALAADWLVSAWDQNTFLRAVTPATVAVEEVTGRWLVDLLGLPSTTAVGFVTGATTANLTCLATARDELLRRAGWSIGDGLYAAPPVQVFAGRERHDTVDMALRLLGMGAPGLVEADDQGRIDPTALRGALEDAPDGPKVVVLQAGNVHSGAFDPFEEAIAAANDHDAWVHVDGAFGLWAAASPAYRRLMAGCADADSWATDAHKTLNVPYDCGLAFVRDGAAMRATMGMQGDYLIRGTDLEPLDKTPESSRRARAVPVWAVLRSLGREGVAEMVEGFCHHAQRFADGVRTIPGAEVLNDVEFTQVCVSFGSDERTAAVVEALMRDGTAWMSGSRWRDRGVLRIAVSSWATTDEDVDRSLDALRTAAGGP